MRLTSPHHSNRRPKRQSTPTSPNDKPDRNNPGDVPFRFRPSRANATIRAGTCHPQSTHRIVPRPSNATNQNKPDRWTCLFSSGRIEPQRLPKSIRTGSNRRASPRRLGPDPTSLCRTDKPSPTRPFRADFPCQAVSGQAKQTGQNTPDQWTNHTLPRQADGPDPTTPSRKKALDNHDGNA